MSLESDIRSFVAMNPRPPVREIFARLNRTAAAGGGDPATERAVLQAVTLWENSDDNPATDATFYETLESLL